MHHGACSRLSRATSARLSEALLRVVARPGQLCRGWNCLRPRRCRHCRRRRPWAPVLPRGRSQRRGGLLRLTRRPRSNEAARARPRIVMPHVSPRFAVRSDETSPQPLRELSLELSAATRRNDALPEFPTLDNADRRKLRHPKPRRELRVTLDRDAYEFERLVVLSPLQDLREESLHPPASSRLFRIRRRRVSPCAPDQQRGRSPRDLLPSRPLLPHSSRRLRMTFRIAGNEPSKPSSGKRHNFSLAAALRNSSSVENVGGWA